ncbi:MAG: glycosyltransferase family 4 protein [Deltaproteobacteria bacterium]|nr:glycosyltransferase family 4 protein [Deltaproteobacteria bacterium]MBT6488947.1 glycosyltransferase family 4 protein [Deltaproteobacteria bacterium]
MQRRFKVAVLAACPFPSHQGTQVFVRHLAEAQSDAGHHVELLSYDYGDGTKPSAFIHHRAPSLNAGLRSGPSLKRLVNDTTLAIKTRRVVSRGNFDVLHAHNVEGLLIGVALKASGLKIALIYHAHNTMKDELPTYFSRVVTRFCASIAGKAFDLTAPRMADAVIVFDRYQRELQIRSGVKPEKVFVVAPSLKSEELRETKARNVCLPEGRFLVYSGNPDGYQNLELLWSAFEGLRALRLDVKLLILSRAHLGDFGPNAESLVAEGAACFRQYQSREEMVGYLKRAEIGLSTRTLSTGFPVKLINYVQLGLKAVVVADSVSAPAPTGVWLAGAGVESFISALVAALDSPGPSASLENQGLMQMSTKPYDEVYGAVIKQLTSETFPEQLS